MKGIILAAGLGSRLRPLTNEVPKCLVRYKGKSIIDYSYSAFIELGLSDLTIVTGYRSEKVHSHFKGKKIDFVHNEFFDKTNMMYSLMCSRGDFDGKSDIIVSYGDIVYTKSVLESLANNVADVSVVVDDNWYELWKARMPDPLADAETLKINNGRISEIGKKPERATDIESQYIGLIKFSAAVQSEILKIYDFLLLETNNENLYVTDFIQHLIDNTDIEVCPVRIRGGWLEIDSVEDLAAYEHYTHGV